MTKRNFYPGEEWLFLKIYCSPSFVDEIIGSVILSAAKRLFADKIIDKWFFLRYSDPDFHIRLRFHMLKSDDTSTILSLINKRLRPFIRDKKIYRICIDTYQRELERYGETDIETVESIFFIDSSTIASLINHLLHTNTMAHKWLLSFPLVDQFLNSSEMTIEDKINLMTELCNIYERNFGTDKNFTHDISVSYRKYSKSIEAIMDLSYISDRRIKSIFSNRDKSLKFYDKDLIRRDLTSLLHMTLNRLFSTNNVKSEFITYCFLLKIYKKELALKTKKL